MLLIGKDTLQVLDARGLISRIMLKFSLVLKISKAKYCARFAQDT